MASGHEGLPVCPLPCLSKPLCGCHRLQRGGEGRGQPAPAPAGACECPGARHCWRTRPFSLVAVLRAPGHRWQWPIHGELRQPTAPRDCRSLQVSASTITFSSPSSGSCKMNLAYVLVPDPTPGRPQATGQGSPAAARQPDGQGGQQGVSVRAPEAL